MLEGIKVVEMATYIAAPAAGGVMADWGADVIKIEPLGGCPMRNFFATAMTDDYPDNPVFALDNRGKRAKACDAGVNHFRVQGVQGVKIQTLLCELAGAHIGYKHICIGG